PVDDRIDGGAVRGGDVDALVEREAPAAVQDGVERGRAEELGARVAEAAADRVLSVEGLDGVAEPAARGRVGGSWNGCARRLGRRLQRTEGRERREGRGGGGRREEELRGRRAEDAAPCAAD